MSANSIRSHRVIIASLFLPHTVTLCDDSSSPENTVDSSSPTKTRGNAIPAPPQMPDVIRRLQQSAPRSIVDDLKTRATSPAIAQTPTVNDPFGKPIGASTPFGAPPPLPRQQSQMPMPHMAMRRSKSKNLSRSDDGFIVESNSHCNGGLKNAIESVSNVSPNGEKPRLRKKLWVGTIATPGQTGFSDELKTKISGKLRDKYDSETVWVPDATFEKCYDAFCHQVLWPALHYSILDAPKTNFQDSGYLEESYDDYVKVNQQFADTILKTVQEGDIIWVNDYHLMLLPAMLRASGTLPNGVGIGFFLHAAFPSSEIFRCLSMRESLLTGLLGADLLGFQTVSYARHFRQTVSRILSLEAVPRGIQLGEDFDYSSLDKVSGAFRVKQKDDASKFVERKGRFVDVGAFPMGIDVDMLNAKREQPEVTEWISLLRQRYAGMKILVARDKLDSIQGVKEKIKAFELFLEKYPEFREKVVLIQVSLPSASTDVSSATSATMSSALPSTASASSISSTVLAAVSHVNARFSTLTYTPVIFLHTQDVSFSQYLALLSVADAFIVTSFREGMALRTHEYVVCQEGKKDVKKGGLVLSEFTGSYSYTGFRSCVAINPWDTRGTADGIHKVLTMPPDEADSSWEDLHNHVITQSAQAFVTTFLTRCLRASTRIDHYDREVDGKEVPNLKENLGRVVGKWRHSEKRLVLVDWEDTLVEKVKGSAQIESSEEETKAIELLKKLTEERKNEVWVLSGLPAKSGPIERLAKEVAGVGIVAENGCFVHSRRSSEWKSLVSSLNMTWKGPCLEILNYFVERTPGSLIEEREATIVWRYWTGTEGASAGRSWARRQAAEAQNHIFDSLGERYGLRIVPGANSFLVIPNNVSRSTAVGAILQSLGQPNRELLASPTMIEGDGGVDMVLAVSGDEKLLRRLNDVDNPETVSTRGKITDAKWVLERAEVLEVLGKLADGK